jgi:hypothetical protein
MFVAKPYNPFEIGPLLDYLVAAKKIGTKIVGMAKPQLVT